MASGESGQTGQNVTSHVERDMRRGQDNVTTLLHQTEVYPAQENPQILEYAYDHHAQVRSHSNKKLLFRSGLDPN